MAGPIRTKESSPRNSSKPYSPKIHPQSPWRILNIFNYLNPLRGSNQTDDSDRSIEAPSAPFPNTPTPDIQEISLGNPADVLAQRGQEMADALAGPPEPQAPAPQVPDPVTPVRSNHHPRLSKSSSPEENIITVVNFLKEKVNQTVSEVEVSGMIHLLEQVVPAVTVPEVREPFRFSRNIPAAGHHDDTTNATQPPTFYTKEGVATASTMPPRMLTSNPNGSYYWHGGGSSKVPPKPRVNRYRSPAFGPPRPKTERFIILDSDTSDQKKPDNKRRRVEDKAESSSQSAALPQSAVPPPPAPVKSPAPAPSSTRASQSHAVPLPTPHATSAHANGASSSAAAAPPARHAYVSPSARRTAIPPRPTLRDTAPAKPSPLRQAWGQSQSSASTASPPQSPQSRPAELPGPSRSVAYMTALIKEATPPTLPDVRNPYQTASRVKPNPERKKRPRVAPKKVETPKDIESEYSAQRIIEATVPPGSKRSRPPTHFEKRPAAAPVSFSMDVEPSQTLPPPPPPPAVRRSSRIHRAQLPQHPAHSEPAPKNGRPKPPVVVIIDDDEVDELEDEDEVRTTKKQKQEHISFASSSSAFQPTPAANGSGSGNGAERRTKPPTTVIEEVDDVDMPLAQKPKAPIRPAEVIEPTNDWNRYAKEVPAPKASSSSSGLSQPVPVRSAFAYNPMKSSAPKEPSKLRYSYKADLPSPPARPSAPAPPSEAPLRTFSRPASDDMTVDTPAAASRSGATDPKDTARAMNVDSLPRPTLAYPATASSSSSAWNQTRLAAHSVPRPDLPHFDLRATPAVIVRAPAKAAASGANWKCGLCGLQNPASALDKCTICENPR